VRDGVRVWWSDGILGILGGRPREEGTETQAEETWCGRKRVARFTAWLNFLGYTRPRTRSGVGAAAYGMVPWPRAVLR
jgi:hypothetical protein